MKTAHDPHPGVRLTPKEAQPIIDPLGTILVRETMREMRDASGGDGRRFRPGRAAGPTGRRGRLVPSLRALASRPHRSNAPLREAKELD